MGLQSVSAPMRDGREKETMGGWMNDGLDDEFDQGHARRVRVDVGWVAFCGARRLRAFRVATVGSREWWGELRLTTEAGGWSQNNDNFCVEQRRDTG